MQTLQRLFQRFPMIVPAIVIVGATLCFSLVSGERFLSPFNLSLIIQQVSIIGTLAIAQTLVILTMGIDLSVGGIMVLTSVVMGRMAVDFGMPPLVALLIGFAAGAICGIFNGVLVTRFRLTPFIATLGSWNMFAALTLWFSSGQTIQYPSLASAGELLLWTGKTVNLFGARFSYGSIMMLLLIVLVWYLLRLTAWGRHIYAVGDDQEAAELAGIRSGRVLLSVYLVAGVICAVAAWVLIGRVGAISPQAGFMSNLNSITAVVIGGTSLFGGRGSIWGTLVGALIVGVFRNGLALAGVEVLWQQFSIGLLVIAAVAIDQWIRRMSM